MGPIAASNENADAVGAPLGLPGTYVIPTDTFGKPEHDRRQRARHQQSKRQEQNL